MTPFIPWLSETSETYLQVNLNTCNDQYISQLGPAFNLLLHIFCKFNFYLLLISILTYELLAISQNIVKYSGDKQTTYLGFVHFLPFLEKNVDNSEDMLG